MSKCCTMLLLSVLFLSACSSSSEEESNPSSINSLYHNPNFKDNRISSKIETFNGLEFNFDLSSNEVITTASFSKGLAKIAHFLKQHPKQNLIITGKFGASERQNKNTNFVNLGFARAESIKKRLIAHGVSEKQIVLQSKEFVELSFSDSALLEGVTLSLENKFLESALSKAVLTKADYAKLDEN